MKLIFASILFILFWAESGVSESQHAVKSEIISANRLQKANSQQYGSEQSPIVVKVIPTEKSTIEATAEANEKEEKKTIDNRLVFYTGCLAAIGLMQLIVFGLQARRLRQTVGATKEAANAAQNSAEALISVERAYVFVDVTLYEGKIMIEYQNHGKTPAVINKIYCAIDIQRTPPVEINQELFLDVPPGVVIGSSKKYLNNITQIAQKRIKELKGRRYEWSNNLIYCYGRVEYTDVLKRPQSTTYCWEFDRHHSIFKISDSKLNDYT